MPKNEGVKLFMFFMISFGLWSDITVVLCSYPNDFVGRGPQLPTR